MYVCCCVCVPNPITWEPFLRNRHFCLCIWLTDSIKMFKLRASIPLHSPSSCPKLRNSYKWLQRYGSGRTHTHGHTETHTRPTTRFPTGDQYQWGIISSHMNHLVYIYSGCWLSNTDCKGKPNSDTRRLFTGILLPDQYIIWCVVQYWFLPILLTVLVVLVVANTTYGTCSTCCCQYYLQYL